MPDGEIDFSAARTLLNNDGTCRALFMASFMPPAALFNGPGIELIRTLEDGCPFCATSLGNHDHVFGDAVKTHFL